MCLIGLIGLTSCEKEIDATTKADGNVQMTFSLSFADFTRSGCADWFHKLNVQLFDTNGDKVFSQVKTQVSTDADFGTLSCQLAAGTYTVVAVGHSSAVSATIKSPTVCQFTAQDGKKLTDTFCCCQQIVVSADGGQFSFDMYRAVAMVQFCFSDEDVPVNFSRLKIDYTGGSANFNPTTLEGITKSTQSELRAANGIQTYQAFTFPYMAESGILKMTVTALDVDGNTIRQREFLEVPVTRNRITTYEGKFFEEGDGNITQSGFGFTVNGQWEGEDTYEF